MAVEPEVLQQIARAGRAFSPGAPIDQYALFAGRSQQVQKVINAINQRGQHVVLYGERGVGKTSLTKVLAEIFTATENEGIASGSVNADGTDTFASLWQKILRQVLVEVESQQAGFNTPVSRELVPLAKLVGGETPIKPDDVRYVLARLDKPTIVIIDELDRVTGRGITTQLADTIKSLSDYSVDATLILVGVADSVDGLIAEHQSVERNLMQVRMPRMRRDELDEILDKGLSQLGMTIDPDAKARIATLSDGLPHYTHLLGLHAAQAAIRGRRGHVEMADVDHAIGAAVDQTQESILNAYHHATRSPQRGNLYARVLLACALAPTDEVGSFAAADVRGPMSEIMDKPYGIPAFSQHLKDFTDAKRGPVLRRTGTPRTYRFRFINPLLQPFVILHGLAKHLITEEQVGRLRAGTPSESLEEMGSPTGSELPF